MSVEEELINSSIQFMINTCVIEVSFYNLVKKSMKNMNHQILSEVSPLGIIRITADCFTDITIHKIKIAIANVEIVIITFPVFPKENICFCLLLHKY